MKSVLSITEHDYYAYPLPIVVWSWAKIGIDSVVFCPKNFGAKVELAKKYCPNTEFHHFECEERKEATFSQVSRVFGSTVCNNEDEVLIVGDSDLAVFGVEFDWFRDGQIRVIGADLLSPEMNQYPMCFIGMSVKNWNEVFGIKDKMLQEALDETVGQLQSISFRGDFWSFDQWYSYKKITESGNTVTTMNRAKYPERFATRRVDRDNAYWRQDLNPDSLIDAHLWRPGHSEENFTKILELFQIMYPNDNFDWLITYTDEYRKLT